MYYNYKNDIAKLDKNIMKMNMPLLSKIWKRYKKFDSGIITAYCNKNTEKENYEKFRELAAVLIGSRYSVTQIEGTSIDNYEDQQETKINKKYLIVFDYRNQKTLKHNLICLGEIYEQDFVTFNSANEKTYCIIGTSKKISYNYPEYGKEKKLNKLMFSNTGEFYSTIEKLPIIFNDSTVREDSYFDSTIFEYSLWTKKYLVDKANEILKEKINSFVRYKI